MPYLEGSPCWQVRFPWQHGRLPRGLCKSTSSFYLNIVDLVFTLKESPCLAGNVGDVAAQSCHTKGPGPLACNSRGCRADCTAGVMNSSWLKRGRPR